MSTEKELVRSFIGFLKSSKAESENAKNIISLLQEEFSIDPSAAESTTESVDLLNVFTTAFNAHQKDDEVKFNTFLSLLEKKGYFNGAEQGSEEYQSRVERARKKFEKHNNPYSGMTAEEVKTKGNEFMSQGKYEDAIQAYTKAIELNPENAIYFANRAAAYTHLKNYSKSILDSERAIALNPMYAKSFSRLGTAYFYDKKYDDAVTAFRKACELEPENASYKDDLKRAEEKAAASTAGGGAGGIGSFPGAFGNGFPDMSQISALMSNPEFMQMAQSMAQKPEIASMMQSMMNGQLNPEQLAGTAVPDGEITRTPFGDIPTSRLRDFPQLNNPKFEAIREDIRVNGFGAMSKYMSDPDVLGLMSQMSSVFSGASQNSPSSS